MADVSSSRRRTALRWGLRLLGLGLVAFVLTTQVRWHDEVTLRDGSVLSGRARETTSGWVVGTEGGEVDVPRDRVAVRVYGGRETPDVSYGLPSIARRLHGGVGETAAVLAVLLGMLVLTAWRWLVLLRVTALGMPFGRAVRLTFVGSFFNIVVPGSTGGDVVKAWYAAKATGAPTRAVLSVFVDRVIGLFGLAVFAAGVLWLAPDREGYGPARTLVGIVLGSSVLCGVLFLSRRLRRGVGLSRILRRLPFQRVLREADAGLVLYRSHPWGLATAIGLSLVNHAGVSAAVWLLAGALGIPSVDLGACLALVPVVSLLSAVPLLPGGWGVGELAFAYFFGQVGVPATEAITLSVVFRLLTLAASLPGGVLWLAWRDHASRTRIAAEIDATQIAPPAPDPA